MTAPLVLAVAMVSGVAAPTAAATYSCSEYSAISSRPSLRQGDHGSCVTLAQRLLDSKHLFNYSGGYTDYFGPITQAGVIELQREAGLSQTGVIGPATWQALGGNPLPQTVVSGLPAICVTAAKSICVVKASGSHAMLYAVQNGQVVRSFYARTGDARGPDYVTVEGVHEVYWKDRNHLSSIYNNAPMPDSLFFYGGEAIHFSPDFAANGYGGAGSSAGCVNLDTRSGADWLYDWAPLHTPVIVTR